MRDSSVDKTWGQIAVPARQFQDRLLRMGQAATGSFLSQLALLHQVAKAYAQESLPPSATTEVSIEEITDPPLYGQASDEDMVLIQFSYQPA